MSFSHPWALVALAVPAVWLILAWIRPRPRSIIVGSLTLWQRALARADSTRRPVESVPPAVVLGLMGMTLLAGAWAGPRLAAGPEPHRRVRVVLDRSAGMRALRPDGRSRWDHARARAAALLRSLSEGDQVELIVVPDADLGTSAPAGRPAEIADRLERLEPSTAEVDWPAALAARAVEPAATVVFTSRLPVEPLEGVRIDLIGGRPDNLAVSPPTAVELPDGRRQIMVEVRNTGSVPAAAEVALLADATALPEAAEQAGVNGPRRVEVPPGQARRRWWTGRLPAGAVALRAELRIDDALTEDNTASAPLTTGGRLKVAVVGTAEPNLDRLLAAHPRVTRVDAAAQADVVIAIASPPPADFRGHVILVDPPAQAGTEPTATVTNVVISRVAPDADTPFARGDLVGLPLRRAVALSTSGAAGRRPVAWVEPGGSAVAAVWEDPPGRRWTALGFACDRANVPTDSAGRWSHRGLVVFWGRLLDDPAEPATRRADPPRSTPPAAVEDRPLDPATVIAGLPREGAAPPRELWPWAAGFGAMLLAAAWAVRQV